MALLPIFLRDDDTSITQKETKKCTVTINPEALCQMGCRRLKLHEHTTHHELYCSDLIASTSSHECVIFRDENTENQDWLVPQTI